MTQIAGPNLVRLFRRACVTRVVWSLSAGESAGVVQSLDLTGSQVGVAVTGTFTNPALVAAAVERPDLHYVNVHTTTCPAGAVRGQFA